MTPDHLRHLFHPRHADDYAIQVGRSVEHLANHLRGVTRPTCGHTPHEAAAPVAAVDLDQPLGDLDSALSEVTRLWIEGAVWFHDPGYAAHLNCPVVIPALAGEALLSAVNSSLDTFDQSVGATFMERHLIDWAIGRIGWDHGDGVFTSGGSQSNLQALTVARDLADGPVHIFTSEDGHFSVQKAARLLGLRDEAVICLPTTADRRMDPAALERALDNAHGSAIVVATAGTTDFGAIDPLEPIARLCRAHGAWLHVDAAYGGGLLTSQRHRHLLAGIEGADSVTIDFHKTFFQPVSSSAVLVRNPQALGQVTWHADYLNPKDCDQPNQVDKSLQTTRRFDALKLWMTLRVMGPDVIGTYVDSLLEQAATAYQLMLARADLDVALAPHLSTLVFRYRPAEMARGAALDRLNKQIRAELFRRGNVVIAGTRHAGDQWLKLTLLNPMTTPEDLARIVGEICAVAETVAAQCLPDSGRDLAVSA